LDETFFIDLPSAKEREAILGVHLHLAPGRLTDRPPPLASPPAAFAQIAREARDFSGAELEAALVEARLSAFAAGRPLDASDFRTAIEATVPLAVTRRESVDRLRAWATTRARPASRS
jgi:SpoVK/Ycf46/Vps4 family AAA+-type ATPase